MRRKDFSNDIDHRLLINIYLDNEYKFNHLAHPLSTLEDLKKIILFELDEYSINYKMEYNEVDITRQDSFTLFQIFNHQIKDEYNIYLTLTKTLKKYENQKVLITYEEGDVYLIIYKILSMKWIKQIPNISNRVSFSSTGKFPFNSKYCHVLSNNKIIITGGVGHEYTACYYDFDTNNIIDLPKMKHPRDRHAMISVGNNNVFIIGGDNSKKVTCLNIEYESYEDYPDLKCERKDPSVCYVDNKFLYVFMGYCNQTGGHAKNFEKLDISVNSYCENWHLLPIDSLFDLPIPKSYSGVAFIKSENCFYFFGGSKNSTVDNKVIQFIENNQQYEMKKTKYCLPFKAIFNETALVQPNELIEEYYLFAYGTHRLIHFKPKEKLLEEIQQEWLE